MNKHPPIKRGKGKIIRLYEGSNNNLDEDQFYSFSPPSKNAIGKIFRNYTCYDNLSNSNNPLDQFKLNPYSRGDLQIADQYPLFRSNYAENSKIGFKINSNNEKYYKYDDPNQVNSSSFN